MRREDAGGWVWTRRLHMYASDRKPMRDPVIARSERDTRQRLTAFGVARSYVCVFVFS